MGYIGNNKVIVGGQGFPPKAKHTGFDAQRELCGVGMKSLLPFANVYATAQFAKYLYKVLSLSAIRLFTSSTSHCLRLSERF